MTESLLGASEGAAEGVGEANGEGAGEAIDAAGDVVDRVSSKALSLSNVGSKASLKNTSPSQPSSSCSF